MGRKVLMALMGLEIGGAETHVVELSKELKRKGWDVDVVSNGGVYEAELEKAGVRCFRAPLNRRRPLPMLSSFLALRKIIREEKPDVVHAHARIPAFLCGILQKRMGFPFVTSAHWVFDTSGLLGKLSDWGEQTVAVSDDIKDYLKDNYSVPDENIIVTINGIDTERFSPEVSGDRVLAEFGFSKERPVISYVSRMDESRALVARQLVEIAPRLREAVPGVQLLIAGGGDSYDEIKALADARCAEAEEDYIAMPGARTDINEIAAAGDIFVGVSRSALEAMAAEKPVIVAGNEGYIGIFSEDKLQISQDTNFCCRGCEMPEPETLLEDIKALFAMSPEERAALGRFGREVIKKHDSVTRMAEDCEEAYRRVRAAHASVVVSGYYGFRNLGDDAILLSLRDRLGRICPEAGLTALSKRPAETEQLCGIAAADRFSPFAVRRAIRSCSLFVSGGGSLLQDHTSTRSLLYYTWLIRMAKRYGKPVLFYANGIGPVSAEKNRRRVREVCEAADIITLRDQSSLEELRSMGVTNPNIFVTADPVYSLGKGDPRRGRELLKARGIDCGEGEKPIIGVSVRFSKGTELAREQIAAFLNRQDARIAFIDMQQPADGEAAASVRELLKPESFEIEAPYAPQDMIDMMACMEAVVSTRLHSMIFAACAGVPALGIDYDPKVRACAEQLGMPLIGTLSDLDPDEASAKLAAVLADRAGYAEKIKAACAELSAKAAENDEKFASLII